MCIQLCGKYLDYSFGGLVIDHQITTLARFSCYTVCVATHHTTQGNIAVLRKSEQSNDIPMQNENTVMHTLSSTYGCNTLPHATAVTGPEALSVNSTVVEKAIDKKYTQICRQPHDTDDSLLPVLELPLSTYLRKTIWN